MRVTVQLFARLRELAGCSRMRDARCRDGASVEDVWRALAAEHPALAPFGRRRVVRGQHRFRPDGPPRSATATHVAFLPPVSGGSDLNL